MANFIYKAGPPRLELGTSVLETDVLPLKLQTRNYIITKFAPAGATNNLLLHLFKDNMLPKLGAIFFELYFAFNQLLILARPIDFAGGFVPQLYELCLFCHSDTTLSYFI